MSERVPAIRVTAMPADTNPYGGVFGGWLMGQMGLACGDELSIYVDLKKQGRTSLTLAARAIARARDSNEEFEVATGDFTFVALDANDKPRAIAGKEEDHG